MDADNDIYTYNVGVVDQNSVHIEHCGLGEEDVPEKVERISDCSMMGVGPGTTSEIVGVSNGNGMVDPSTQKVEVLTNVHVAANGSLSAEEVETKEPNQVKDSKPQNNQGRGKSEKPACTKKATVTSVKKVNNRETKATSNGTLSADTRPKQPVAKTRSFNDRPAVNSNLGKTAKIASATSNSHKAKLPKSDLMSASDKMLQCEGNVDKSKLKPLRKGPAAKPEENGESVESPTAAEARARKMGKLPAYGFSFRCDERAEKRREFYTKLEERIHAQEQEKNNQQAKSKESQEAELRMLRKSLNFKATPMPTFYQEPPPPKVELKKIPTTRPRSPKLGRKKNSSSVEGDGDRSDRPERLSLDEKVVSQTGKGPASVQSKRPQRNSLPRLPSEKTRLSKSGPEVVSATQVQDNVINGSPLIARIEELSLSSPASVPIAHVDDEEVPVTEGGPVPIARVEEGEVLLSDLDEASHRTENGPSVEDQAQSTIEQEGISLEH